MLVPGMCEYKYASLKTLYKCLTQYVQGLVHNKNTHLPI